MEKKQLLYEGKAKRVYATDDPGLLVVEYKDDATAFNGLKHDRIAGKGILNNKISAFFFALLAEYGCESHFVKLLSEREMLVKKLEMIPAEVVVRNLVAGSLAKRFGLKEGKPLARPVVELYYKNDALGDPMINEYHLYALGMATPAQVEAFTGEALRINQVLSGFLRERGLLLVDLKLEFGVHNGKVLLGDEISPDTCRFWDAKTGEKLDKDRFRQDLGGVEEAYREIYRRLTGETYDI
ncbi:MAG: phosphoribosylaminoimidazolesuccinocarboxamide synthase [Firmicutes bacterium]|nr:phosphoribosylaminoimidazolesuccinocarboxamide synthase [Bacillota bacterium]